MPVSINMDPTLGRVLGRRPTELKEVLQLFLAIGTSPVGINKLSWPGSNHRMGNGERASIAALLKWDELAGPHFHMESAGNVQCLVLAS